MLWGFSPSRFSNNQGGYSEGKLLYGIPARVCSDWSDTCYDWLSVGSDGLDHSWGFESLEGETNINKVITQIIEKLQLEQQLQVEVLNAMNQEL